MFQCASKKKISSRLYKGWGSSRCSIDKFLLNIKMHKEILFHISKYPEYSDWSRMLFYCHVHKSGNDFISESVLFICQSIKHTGITIKSSSKNNVNIEYWTSYISNCIPDLNMVMDAAAYLCFIAFICLITHVNKQLIWVICLCMCPISYMNRINACAKQTPNFNFFTCNFKWWSLVGSSIYMKYFCLNFRQRFKGFQILYGNTSFLVRDKWNFLDMQTF